MYMLKGCKTNGISIQRTKPFVLCSLTDLFPLLPLSLPHFLPIFPFPSPSLLSFLFSCSMYICWWRLDGLLLWRPLWLNFSCLLLMFFDYWLWGWLRNPTLPPAHNVSAADFTVRFLTQNPVLYIHRSEIQSKGSITAWSFGFSLRTGFMVNVWRKSQQWWLRHQWCRERKELSWP